MFRRLPYGTTKGKRPPELAISKFGLVLKELQAIRSLLQLIIERSPDTTKNKQLEKVPETGYIAVKETIPLERNAKSNIKTDTVKVQDDITEKLKALKGLGGR